MKKKSFLISFIIISLVIVLIVIYLILRKKNEYVKEWDSFPREQKILNVKLFLEKPIYWIFPPTIDTAELNISKEKLITSIKLGADWIISMQEENGRYNYWYNPVTDEYSSSNDDNFLRQAGTGYSLLLAFEVTYDSAYLKSALRNLDYLYQFKKDIDSTKSYFLYRQKAKLGGIALPMLSMLKYRQLTTDTIFDSDVKKLAETVLLLQDFKEKGKFKSTYIYRGDYNYEDTKGWESLIYPGEAMLALTFMYKEFKEDKYLEALDKACTYYSSNRIWRKSSFIPWTASAYSELYKVNPKDEYAEFVYKMCNSTFHRQNLNKNRITLGSYYSEPTVFTSTTFEGVGDAIAIAKMRGDKDIEKKYTERSLIAYKWLMQLQYQKTDTLPEQAIGGFRRSLHQAEIRIDNTQHAISAMCRGLKYIYNTEK